mmetsp:Transcript_66963/g.155414  ORF Transcript_66963/g.155414 Transcript_66963/m.155414 type:complete len:107 (-) Transcript_66963:622-942(-)
MKCCCPGCLEVLLRVPEGRFGALEFQQHFFGLLGEVPAQFFGNRSYFECRCALKEPKVTCPWSGLVWSAGPVPTPHTPRILIEFILTGVTGLSDAVSTFEMASTRS